MTNLVNIGFRTFCGGRKQRGLIVLVRKQLMIRLV
jgi:hypothetical protein